MSADPPQAADAPDAVMLNFLPEERRRLTQQGVELFALHYYAPWLGVLVPERDRLGSLEIRYDPRDISRIYVRDPSDGQFRVTKRRDGATTSLTLWEHRRARREKRATRARTAAEKIAISREIGAIVAAARAMKAQTPRSTKTEARDAVRATQAAEALKPYQTMEPSGAAPSLIRVAPAIAADRELVTLCPNISSSMCGPCSRRRWPSASPSSARHVGSARTRLSPRTGACRRCWSGRRCCAPKAFCSSAPTPTARR